jgi:hypothetical protein
MGDGTKEYGLVPTEVTGGHSWVDVAGVEDMTCGLRADSTLWCWGLFEGTDPLVPTQIGTATDWNDVLPGCARKTSDDTFCWDSSVATFDNLGNSVALSRRNDATCLVRADGTLCCRGFGS